MVPLHKIDKQRAPEPAAQERSSTDSYVARSPSASGTCARQPSSAAAAVGSRDTRLTSPRFQQLIESRDSHLAALTGVAFAEGVIVKEPLLRDSLFRLAGGANPGLRS